MTEKLPVVATVAAAFSTLRFLSPAIVRFGWLTLLTMTAQFLLANFLVPAAHESSAFELLSIGFFCAALGVLNLPVITSIHRLVLEGASARAGLSMGREEWSFLWSGFRMLPLLLLMAILIGFAVAFLSGALAVATKSGLASETMFAAPLQMLEAVAITIFSCRYFLIFPAAAVGRPLKLGDAAKLLKGNVLRLCLILGPVWITGWCPQLIQKLLSHSLPLTSALLSACFGTVSTMLFAVTLSLAFQRLAERPDRLVESAAL